MTESGHESCDSMIDAYRAEIEALTTGLQRIAALNLHNFKSELTFARRVRKEAHAALGAKTR